MINKYKTIIISDVHLGSKESKAEYLHNFLKNNKCETLYMVGDIIDGWKISQNKWKWTQSHTNVIKKILGLSKKGTNIIYIAGNHDEFLRVLIPFNVNFENISIVNQAEYIGINGKRYLVIHGDLFDGISKIAPWLSILGDKAYDFVLDINSKFNWIRHRLGFGYWSLSKYLKLKVKSAVGFIFKFEENLVSYCKKRKFDGVICGHIHKTDIKTIDGVDYLNSGDWVENMSALVENYDGTWEIIIWDKIINNEKNINNN